MTPPTEQTDGLSFRAYLRVVARWKWLIVALVIFFGVAAFAYARTRTPLYQAAAQLMYEPQVNVADLSSGITIDQTQETAAIESVPTIIGTKAVSQAAQHQLGSVDTWYTVTAQTQLAADNSGNYSSIVLVVGVSPSASVAADAANAYAQSFVNWRQQREQKQLQQAADVLQKTLDTYTSSAARASSEYLMLQQEYRNLTILMQTANGNFSVVIPATTPSTPFSPRTLRTSAVGLAGGLVLGLLLAFLLEQFDTRLRSEDQVLSLLKYPVLGRIPRAAKKQMSGSAMVATLTDPSGHVAEAFRILRGNLDFVNVDGGVKSVLITSSAQREGKSVTACNLAASLALSGKRVVLVDGDLRNPHIHIYLGLKNAVGLSSVLVHAVTLEDALVRVPLAPTLHVGSPGNEPRVHSAGRGTGVVKVSPSDDAGISTDRMWAPEADGGVPLAVLTSGMRPPNAGELVASVRMKSVIDELAAQADIVLIDAPAMLVVGDTMALASGVDGVVYVVDPDMARRPMLVRAAEQLDQLPCRKLGVVLITNRESSRYYTYHTQSYESPEKPGKWRRK